MYPFSFVTPLQFYHLHCFACSACEKQLVPGELYTVNSGKLFCKRDYEQLYHDPLDSPTGKPTSPPPH